MKFYVVTFNRKLGASYTKFHEEFVADPKVNRWFHYTRSSYLIGTELTARELSDHFRLVAVKYGLPQRHLVIRVDLRDRHGFLPKGAWDWIQKQLKTMD